jgi:hypothetical protein
MAYDIFPMGEFQGKCDKMLKIENPKPRVDLIKLFWRKFIHVFCKLDHFINVTIIFLCCEKI